MSKRVHLTADFEPASGGRLIRAGTHILSAELATEAEAAGLVGEEPAAPRGPGGRFAPSGAAKKKPAARKRAPAKKR